MITGLGFGDEIDNWESAVVFGEAKLEFVPERGSLPIGSEEGR